MEASSTAPPDAVPAKQLPPEKPEAVRLRTKVVLSFWAVVLLLGLPTWWQTTSIYRADLPLQDMLNWADGLNTPSAIPLHIWITAPNLPCSEAQAIVRETQQALDDLNEYPTLHQRLHLVNALATGKGDGSKTPGSAEPCGENPLILGLGPPAFEVLLEPSPDRAGFVLDPVSASAIAHIPPGMNVAKHLAGSLHELFREEQIAAALQTVSLAGQSHHAQAFLKSQPHEVVARVEGQISRAYKPSPEFHLTFSLFTASGAPSSWDIDEALREHVQPIVQALSSVAEFGITTQVQLYSSFSPSIHTLTLDGHNGSYLRQDDLTAFVNAAEWPLAPSLGDGPTINFILYVPALDQIPLSIEGNDGTSWLIPQWGGIQILNPPLFPHPAHGMPALPARLSREILQEPFDTFSSQLLSLLGVLQSQGTGRNLPLRLRLGAYKRLSTLTLYLKAASSLGSLSRLAQGLSNIPIPRNVAQLVDNAIADLRASCQAFLESNWDAGLAHAKSAFRDSDKAFFDKSMVGMVYFPDEHKVAVYLPLLGPIGVPLIMGGIRELKRFLSARKGSNP